MKACRTSAAHLVVLLCVALAAVGCSTSGDSQVGSLGIRGLEVSGSVGKAPVARIAAPLAVPTTTSKVVVQGNGPQIQIDQLFVLGVTLWNARTGDQVASTYDPGEKPLVAKSSDDSLFPALVDAVKGQPQGSRVVVAMPYAEAYTGGVKPPVGVAVGDPVIVAADVLAVPPPSPLKSAGGTTVAPPAGTPVVSVLAGDPTTVTAPSGQAPPTDLVVVELIRGTGAPVRAHSLVTLDYLGQDWGERVPFVSTYFKEPAVVPVVAEGSMAAWDEALVGVPAGSRVVVVDPSPPVGVPGETGVRDHGTITWVVDVLGVS